MRRAFLLNGALAILGIALVATPATAQDVEINIKNAPPNANVEVRVTGGGVNESGTATTDAGGDLSMLLNFGSLGKAAPAEVDVYIQDCSGTSSVHLVAEGGEAPECGDETETEECNCRRAGAFWMHGNTTSVSVNFTSGAVSTGTSGQKWTFYVGADFFSLDADPPEEVEGTTRDLSIDDSGTDFSLGLEYALANWIAIGIGYEALGDIGLAATLTSIQDPGVQLVSRGEIDPEAYEIYTRLSYWARANVMLHLMLGAAYWEGTKSSDERILVDGSEVDSFSSSYDFDGWSFLAGAGVDIWFLRSFGIRLAYKFLDMSASSSNNSSGSNGGPKFDVEAQAARFLLLFRW
jgi:hypothetical protein